MKDLLRITDMNADQLTGLINSSIALKRDRYTHPDFFNARKHQGLYFEKPSLRTVTSSEIAMSELGGSNPKLDPAMMGTLGEQGKEREPLKDVIGTLEGYIHVLTARVKRHQLLEEMAALASFPIINALSDEAHPLQTLADLMTIIELKGRVEGLQFVFLADSHNNVASSFAEGATMLGANVICAASPKYMLRESVRERCESHPGKIILMEDPVEAVKKADIIYVDVFTSMGQENEKEQRMEELAGYQLNSQLLKHAKPDVNILHCMPIKRGQEVTEEVIDGAKARNLPQAHNRLHTEKAVLLYLLEGKLYA